MNSGGAFRTEGHPFFEPLGKNGRACITCHQPADAMSVSAAGLQERWKETDGKDPVFAAIDGSNCPDLPQDEAGSHSLLLKRGLFRIAMPWPPRQTPEFRIEVVRDPTGCNKNPQRDFGVPAAADGGQSGWRWSRGRTAGCSWRTAGRLRSRRRRSTR